MPRRGNVPKRDVLPDPMYGSKVVTKLINQIMLDGKKGTAQAIVYEAFKIMGEKLNMYPSLVRVDVVFSIPRNVIVTYCGSSDNISLSNNMLFSSICLL